MAITVSNQDSLVESKIQETETTKKTDSDSKSSSQDKTDKAETEKSTKKGFLSTTLAELRKVDWPSWSHVLNWSLIVILFTVMMAIGLGSVDHLFASGLKLIDCTSPQGRAQPLNQCMIEFANNLTWR